MDSKCVIDIFEINHRRAKGGDKDSQRVVNEQIERHRALLTKADAAEGVGDNQEDEEQNVSKCLALCEPFLYDHLYLHLPMLSPDAHINVGFQIVVPRMRMN